MEQNRKGAMMKPFNLLTLMGLLAAAPLCATSLVIGSTDTTSTAAPFLQVWGTLSTADTTDTSGATTAYCVDAVVVNANGSLSLAEGYTVPSTGSIGGTGSVTGDVTFSDGATLDATAGVLTYSGTLDYGTSTTIALSTAPTGEGTQVLSTTATPTLPNTSVVTVGGTTLDTAQVTSGTNGLYVSVPVSSSSTITVTDESTGTSTELSDDAKAVIVEALSNTEGASSASSVSISGSTNTNATDSSGASAADTLSATQLEGALACFTDVTEVSTSTDETSGVTSATVKVAYNFGISQMKEATIDSTRYIVVGVGVEKSDGTAATYASGTTIALTSGGTAIDATEVTSIEGTTEGSADTTTGMKYFRIPLSTFTDVTDPIEVKATNDGTASASIAE